MRRYRIHRRKLLCVREHVLEAERLLLPMPAGQSGNDRPDRQYPSANHGWDSHDGGLTYRHDRAPNCRLGRIVVQWKPL